MELFAIIAVPVVLFAAAALLTRKQRRMLGATNNEFRRVGREEPQLASPGNSVIRSPSDFGAGL